MANLKIVSNVDIPGHVGFGAQAAIDGGTPLSTGPAIMTIVEENDAILHDNYQGLNLTITANPPSDTTDSHIAANYAVFTKAGNAHNFGDMSGSYVAAYHQGSGTIGDIVGCWSDVENVGAGTASRMTGAEFYVNNAGTCTTAKAIAIDSIDNSGTLDEGYGLFIADQVNATANWAIKTGLGKHEFGGPMGFNGAVATAQHAAIADATDAATTTAQLNILLAYLRLRGDIAS